MTTKQQTTERPMCEKSDPVKVKCPRCKTSCLTRKYEDTAVEALAEGEARKCTMCRGHGFLKLELFDTTAHPNDVHTVKIRSQPIPYALWVQKSPDYNWAKDPDGLLEKS